MYVEKVKYLLSRNVEDIIASTDSLDLIRCYSMLYLNGQQCRYCAASQKSYYNELVKTGLQKAKEMDEAKNRTCVPNWGKGCTNNNGLKCIRQDGNAFYSSLYITDAQALSLLNRGLLSESDFDVLPEGYEKPLEKLPETPEPKKKVRKTTPKE